MSFYPLYGGTDEDAYLSHRLVLASQSDVMEMARLSRSATEIHPSLIRFPTTRVGMYQELNTVFGTQCPPNQQLHHQGSFENEEVYQQHAQGMSVPHQDYSPYVVGQSMPGHNTYPSNLYGSNGDLRNSSQMGLGPPPYHEDASIGSLPGVVSHPELQWLVTTSNVDMRTLTPPNNVSSPHISRNIGTHLDNTSSPSSATITHHQLSQHAYNQPPPLQKVSKKGNPNAPVKPKGTPGRKRKFQDHELSPTEAAKRHVRRERNKVAAAKCRNRRRELTDRLQGETDHLEDNQTQLHQEIMQLQQQKDHLEFILATHSSNCKARIGDKYIQTSSVQLSGSMEEMLVPPPEVMEDMMASQENMLQQQNYYLHMQQQQQQQSPRGCAPVSVIQSAPSTMRQMPQQDMSKSKLQTFSSQGQSFDSTSSDRFPNMNLDFVDAPLNTPVCSLATPSNSTSVFTFPTTPGLTNTVTSNFSFSSDYQTSRQPATPFTASVTSFPAMVDSCQQQQLTCAQAHRRSSSSESPDCVQSPKLIAL